MTFSYVAGSVVDYSNVLSFPSGLRLGGDDGTFRLSVCPPITDSAPLRVPQSPAPRGGGAVGDPLPDVWQLDVQGWFLSDDVNDVQAAIDYLHEKINNFLGWQDITLDTPSWADPRTMTVRLAGQITVDPRDRGDMTVPERVYTIPLIAADPRRYGPSTTTAITTGTNVTNAGTVSAPFVATFVGPLTDPALNGPGVGNIIKLSSVASGQTVTVTTVDPATGTLTALDNTDTDVFSLVVTDTADYIDPGTESWTFTKTSGSGHASMTVRSAW